MPRTMEQSPEDAALALYEALIGFAEPTRQKLLESGIAEETLEAHLPRLTALGMARALDDGTIAVIPPETAIPRYAAALEQAADRTRGRVTDLSGHFRRVRAENEPVATVGVRVTVDLTELARIRGQVLEGARTSIVVIATRTPLNDELLMDPRRTAADPVREGLVRNYVFDASVLDLEGSGLALEDLAAAGVQVRLRPSLALGVIIVDRTVAIVDISNHDASGYGSIVVRHRPLVEALAQLADATFAASRLPPTALPTARGRYGDREARVLALLAAGATDSTIARQLGVSQRTVERDIRRVMEDLEATTRFQAGVQAGRRGLL